MNKGLLLLISIILIISCKSKPIIPSLEIGMEHRAWKDSIRAMLKRGELSRGSWTDDSLTWDYKFRIGDTTVNAHTLINRDGIDFGKLRVLVFHFTGSDGIIKPDPKSTLSTYPSISEEIELQRKLIESGFLYMKSDEGRIISLGGSVFPKSSIEKLYSYLTNLYGSPDSIIDAKGIRIDRSNDNAKIDTSTYRFYFHDKNSIIVLRRSRFFPPFYFVPFWHVNDAVLYQYSKNYDSELRTAIDSAAKLLTPEKLISFPLSYSYDEIYERNGYSEMYLTVSSWVNPKMRKTLAELRPIESMKGRIVIRDKFGDILQDFKDVEIPCRGSLPATGTPGLAKALGENEAVSYNIYTYKSQVSLNHKQINVRLKQAALTKQELDVEFIPEVILFEDGGILK